MNAPQNTFFWHDYETFGREPRRDRPVQFAGIRTNLALEDVGDPVTLYCQPAPDYLPDPEACLLTGITPELALERGVPERDFAEAILAALSQPGTVGVGYNSIRFDDEVTRFLFWRSLIDPYAREWQNDCGRWDLLDVLRCCHALRPGGLQWPTHEDGRPSFKLEHLSKANGVAHEDAHDALSDVRATLALARLVRKEQPKLWDFCLKLRRKQAVVDEIAGAQARGEPLVHISGRYGIERGGMALVWPLAPHPTNRNELIVWDLSADPSELGALGAAEVRERMYTRADALPQDKPRLPIKTIHLNRAPVVIGNLKVLTPEVIERWHLDVDRARRHGDLAAQLVPKLAGLWPDVFAPPEFAPRDVDEDLYGGFVNDADRRKLQRVRALPPEELVGRQPAFDDERLDELVFRFKARNHPTLLDEDEQERWSMQCIARIVDGEFGARTLEAFFESLDALDTPDRSARDRAVLKSLRDYAAAIAP